MMKRISGIIAAPFAPLHPDGTVNLEIVESYYQFLEKNGISGVFINGTTGEGASLTQKEKQLITSAWTACSRADNRIGVINLVGGTCYQECIENAIHSRETGVSAIAVIAPYYFKPPDEDLLAEFLTKIGETVPDILVYYYHIPSFTGVNIPMIRLMTKVSVMLPNFAGIKYAADDFVDLLSCINYKDGAFDIYWGRDECLLSALVLNVKGAVGSTYNYAAPLYNELIREYNGGNFERARKLQQLSVDMTSLLGKYGGIATGKAFMRYIGFDFGKFRSPVKNMTEEMYREFVKDVKSLKMEELFSKK